MVMATLIEWQEDPHDARDALIKTNASEAIINGIHPASTNPRIRVASNVRLAIGNAI
jgi:hypothetical protein